MTTDDEQTKEVERELAPMLGMLAKLLVDLLPAGWGFGLVVFPFGKVEGNPLLWVSNAKREDMVKAMAEFVEKNGGDIEP